MWGQIKETVYMVAAIIAIIAEALSLIDRFEKK
jgi:hypothetical protein